ncbi:MAG: c-type cytochrome [Gammaproteobacteria bacterium]|nr:c-type cytochrome [Gammaproteobacteria bacterium]
MSRMLSAPILLLSSAVLLVTSLTACDSGTPPGTPTNNLPTIPIPHKTTLVASCNSCHGIDGVGNKPDVPFIAGQHASYLETAMRAYLIGDRQHKIMRAAVFDLEVSERQQLAEHFAQLNTAWRSQTNRPLRISRANKIRDIRAGQALSRPCAGCHGEDGNSRKEGVPSLAGLQAEYFIPALESYLQGKRRGAAIMKNFKLSLSQRDIKQLAAFFAVQKRQRSPLGNHLKASDASDALARRCLGCHGHDGNSTHPAIPGLAGQNATYLITAMQRYRDKKRQNKMMVDVAQGLSDEAIRRNAIYFATRAPIAPANRNTVQDGTIKFSPMADGKQLAASCNGCHGDNGNSTTPGIPRLTGLSEDYLQIAIAHYRDNKRQHAVMQLLTRYLSNTDIEKLALYYASQTPANLTPDTRAEKTDSDIDLASTCAGCHGKDGNSQKGDTPSLAGQDADYIVAALHAYKNDMRQHDDMKNAVLALDKKAMRKLADYYSRLPAQKPTVHVMESPEILAQKCDRCHGKDGGKPDADKPRIAGQRQAYLVKALLAYRNKKRQNSMMYNMVAELSRVEIEAIATYYAGQ